MSFPARKIEHGWAIKTPRGRLMIDTVAHWPGSAWDQFPGYLGIESRMVAKQRGYRLVRIVVKEP
jgi:hypothetical protein